MCRERRADVIATRLILALMLASLAGCASNLPRAISDPPAASPPIAAVMQNPAAYVGQSVRWGGSIVAVENRAAETWIEIAARDLGGFGRPLRSDVSQGRYVARLGGFFDPSIYRPDREITVYGTIDGGIERRVGERSYVAPLLRVLDYHLWPEYVELAPPYYDPWWDPLYPYPYYDPFFGPYSRPGWGARFYYRR